MLKIDELNGVYDFTDKVIGTLNRRFVTLFNRLKSLNPNNEKDVISEVTKVYEEADRITREYLLLIATRTYREVCRSINCEDWIEDMSVIWLMEILDGYDPVTKYVYTHEVDRKRARLIEAIISSNDTAKEVENAKRLWAKQARQYADNVTDRAMVKVYKDNNIEYVVWQTEQDEKVCAECVRRNNVRYIREEVPPKPHYGCRCWLIPYGEITADRS